MSNYIIIERDPHDDVIKWCLTQYGTGKYSYNLVEGVRWTMYRYTYGAIRLNFATEEDLTWFKLRWYNG
jgi:hypothetical protein